MPTVKQLLVTTEQQNREIIVKLNEILEEMKKIKQSTSTVTEIKLYNDTNSQLHVWLRNNTNHPQHNLLKRRIADVPKAIWLGDWFTDLDAIVSDARAKGETPVFILYNAIKRDLGGFSAGGAANLAAYFEWIDNYVRKIGNLSTIVVLEPDALPHMPEMSADEQGLRVQMLQGALSRIRTNQNAKVYLDAGHSYWLSVEQTTQMLNKIGVNLFDGFSLNVSNRRPNAELINFGKAVSAQVGNKHFIIDTSRNGVPQTEWCNPPGEKLGTLPTFDTGEPLCDAFLWLKYPGESDGTCNGGPAAGQLWIQRAIELST